MNLLKYRAWISPWGNAEPESHMEYPREDCLHAILRNYELGGYKNVVFQMYTGRQDIDGVDIYGDYSPD